MGALTIPPADASAAPAPAPAAAGGPGGGASGFGTALAAVLGGVLQQGAAPASVPAPEAAGAPAAPADSGPKTPAALLGAAAGLAALLGRAGASAAPVPAGPQSAAPSGTAAPASVPPSAAGQDDVPDAPPALDPAVLAPAVLGAVAAAPQDAPARPGHRRHDDATDQTPAASDAAAALLPVPLAPGAQPPAAPSPAGKAAPGVATAVGRRTTGGPRSEQAADVPPAANPASSAEQDPAAVAAPAPTPASPVDRPSAPASAAPAPSAQLAPVAAAQPPVAAAVTAPAPLVATADPTIAQQLQGPLLSLRSAPEGEHVLVVRVSPDHLGPVTVHAVVSHGDLSVQLFTASADARDALSAMLTDLRSDLGSGATGSATTLSLGTGDAPQQEGRGQQSGTTWFGSGGSNARSARDDRTTWSASPRVDEHAATDRPILSRSTALLDVLA